MLGSTFLGFAHSAHPIHVRYSYVIFVYLADFSFFAKPRLSRSSHLTPNPKKDFSFWGVTVGTLGKNQEALVRGGGILARFKPFIPRNLFARSDSATFDFNDVKASSSQNTLGLVIASILLILMGTFVVLIGWQREFADAYLATNVNIKSFENNRQEWRAAHARGSECNSANDCYTYLKQKSLSIRSYQDLVQPLSNLEKDQSLRGPLYILVQTTIEKSAWKLLYKSGNNDLMIGLPSARYEEANVYVNGDLAGKFIDDARIGVPIRIKSELDDIIIDIVYEKTSINSGLFDPDEERLLITSPINYNAWVRVLVMQSAQRGSWLSNLSFIVMAIFFLLLYVLVDRSPEVLGLALFVGLDAFARSLWYDWLPTIYTAQIADMADSAANIMRLYFMVQLCRFGSVNVVPWLFASLAYALVVSAGSWASALGWSLIQDRVYEINALCALIVAIVGTIIIGITLYKIRSSNQTWRKWALVIAMASCVLYAVAHLHHIYYVLDGLTAFHKARSILTPLSVFLLASSAFVNISTLENRVRVLSDVKAKNDEIKKELELGRIVQSAYMKVPELPAYVDLACYFEAAFYVSGDAYFVHWDESIGRLAVIVGDMTGHGVQAALKASTLQVMAQTIFSDSMRRAGDLGARFVVYEQAVRSFLSDSWKEGDFPTFLGIEIELSTGKVVSHRCNFPFPMIVEQREDGRWLASVWVDRTLTLDAKKSDRRVFFVSASDGVISGSKMFHKVARDLENKLNSAKLVSAELIKQAILDYLKHAGSSSNDDRTMVVFGTKSNSSAA